MRNDRHHASDLCKPHTVAGRTHGPLVTVSQHDEKASCDDPGEMIWDIIKLYMCCDGAKAGDRAAHIEQDGGEDDHRQDSQRPFRHVRLTLAVGQVTLARSFLTRIGARWRIANADSARDRRDWVRARAHYSRALSLTPGRADIWVQLGHAGKESGAFEKAAEAYSRSLAIAPNIADTHLQIAHLRKRQGHLEAAAESFTKAFKLDPTLSGVAAELLALGRTPPKTDAERIAELEAFVSSARERAAQDADRLPSLFADVRADFGELVARVETLTEKASVAAEFAFELSSTRSILGKAFERLASVENDLAAFKDETRALILTVTARPAHEPVKGAAVGAPASNLNVSEENEIAAYS